MNYNFRKASLAEQGAIWEILEQAIQRRKEEGSKQWQDGYPNPAVVKEDIEKGHGYVLTEGDEILGYVALLVNDEPAYAAIEGKWLTDGDFVVYHRVAISEKHLGKGLSKIMLHFIDAWALEHGISSVRADTNFDNPKMMGAFERSGYVYCGEVYFRGAARRAYEKVLTHPHA
jgi:GNAT superfamily N-acetyltransferase